jgi:long-chain acyl-CoA synthetase
MDQKLDEIILRCCASSPTEPCLWWRGAWWSRGTLNEMAVECERNLINSGFSARQRLGLVLPNSPLFLAACIAAWRLGGTVVPVNPMLKYPSAPEYLKSVGAFGAVVSREMEGLAGFMNECGIPAASADLGDAVPEMRGCPASLDPDSGTAVLFHTAGAAGDVKAVPITHRNITSLLGAVLDTMTMMDEDDVVLNAIPNYHSLGFVVGGVMPLAAGIPQVLVPSFASLKTTMSAIRSAGVTIIPALPVMLGMLLGGEREITPVSKVKMIFYGGGDLMPGIAARAKEVFGVEPLEGYGLTEASSVLAFTPSEDAIRPGSSGRILPCFEAKVCDPGGNALPFDADGRLWIRGDALARGYYGNAAASSERFRDGWFDTQDIVRIDSDGFITIVSPAVDVIMAGGVPVYPGEIEAILKRHPEIEDAAVIGVPRGAKGEFARAFVVVKEGSALRPKDVVMYGRSKLPNYKAPRSVKILSELPRDNLGRVLKKELRGA